MRRLAAAAPLGRPSPPHLPLGAHPSCCREGRWKVLGSRKDIYDAGEWRSSPRWLPDNSRSALGAGRRARAADACPSAAPPPRPRPTPRHLATPALPAQSPARSAATSTRRWRTSRTAYSSSPRRTTRRVSGRHQLGGCRGGGSRPWSAAGRQQRGRQQGRRPDSSLRPPLPPCACSHWRGAEGQPGHVRRQAPRLADQPGKPPPPFSAKLALLGVPCRPPAASRSRAPRPPPLPNGRPAPRRSGGAARW